MAGEDWHGSGRSRSDFDRSVPDSGRIGLRSAGVASASKVRMYPTCCQHRNAALVVSSKGLVPEYGRPRVSEKRDHSPTGSRTNIGWNRSVKAWIWTNAGAAGLPRHDGADCSGLEPARLSSGRAAPDLVSLRRYVRCCRWYRHSSKSENVDGLRVLVLLFQTLRLDHGACGTR